jgi:hypothetical protein
MEAGRSERVEALLETLRTTRLMSRVGSKDDEIM